MARKIIDYERIPIPSHTDYKNYNYKERRATILRVIQQAGTPSVISLTIYAKKFGVHHSQIYQDMKVLAHYVESSIGRNVKFKTEIAMNKVIKDLIKGTNADKAKAAKIIMDWNGWLFDIGVQEKAAEKFDIRSQVKELSLEEDFEEFKKIYDGHKKKK